MWCHADIPTYLKRLATPYSWQVLENLPDHMVQHRNSNNYSICQSTIPHNHTVVSRQSETFGLETDSRELHVEKGNPVPRKRKIPLNNQNRIGIQYLIKHQKVRSRQTLLPNGNSGVKCTADNELALAAELELLKYIFREVFSFFSFAFTCRSSRKIKEASAAMTICVAAKSSLYLCYVLKVLCFEEKRMLQTS